MPSYFFSSCTAEPRILRAGGHKETGWLCAGRRNITPLWQPRILVRCRFGGEGWRASHWPPRRIVTRSVFLSLFLLSLSALLSHSFHRHGTRINHRHFNIGWRTIPPPPRYSTKLCREFDQPTPRSPSHETGFYGEILLICQYPPLWWASERASEAGVRRCIRRLMRRRNYGNHPGEMCID